MKQRHDLVIAGFFLTLSVGLWFAIPIQVARSWAPIGVDVRFFPQLITVVIGACSLALLIQALTARAITPVASTRTAHSSQLWATLGFIALYLAGLQVVGYVVSSFLSMSAYMIYLGARPPLKALIVVFAVSLLIFYAFQRLLHVTLPLGTFG